MNELLLHHEGRLLAQAQVLTEMLAQSGVDLPKMHKALTDAISTIPMTDETPEKAAGGIASIAAAKEIDDLISSAMRTRANKHP